MSCKSIKSEKVHVSTNLSSKQAAISFSCAVVLIACLSEIARSQPAPITQVTINATIPTEVVDGNGAPVAVNSGVFPIEFFDDFSWRSFVALNWSALTNTRGDADTTKTVQ